MTGRRMAHLASPTTAYRITGRHGGKRSPSDPEAVRSPKENLSGYRSARRAGSRIPPSATIVTPDAPVNVVKNVQTSTVTTASAPGIQPNIARKSGTRRWEELPAVRMCPAKVNRWIVASVGEVTSRYISTGMEARGTWEYRKRRTAKPPRAANRGAPRNTAAARTTRETAKGARRKIRSDETTRAPATANAAVTARPPHMSEESRTSRHATRANPRGITASASQTGSRGRRYLPSAHSILTRVTPA